MTAEPGSTGVPVCFRHAERETYVRCTRCERPICPDCMVDAAVGFQCPECVAVSGRSLKQGRTLAGARVHGDPALVTKLLVAANVLLYALQFLSDDRITQRWAMQGFAVAVLDQPYRLLTSAFLHASFFHLAMNMLALWSVGLAIEQRLGRWRYLSVYLVSALAGSVLSYAVDSPVQVSVGASGAVFGLFGALGVLFYRLRFDIAGVLSIIALNVVLGFVIPGINWRAHLGGLIAGTLLTAVMVYAPQRHRTWASVVASLLVVAACLGVTAWRTDQIESCVDGSLPAAECDSILG